MTTLKTGSVLTTGTGAGDTQPGLTITFGFGHPIGQAGFSTTDFANAPILAIPDAAVNSQTAVYGDRLGVRKNLLDLGALVVDGVRNPAPMLMPDGTATAGLRWWAGTGAPSASTIGGAAAVGDLYDRRDGGSGTYTYRCTVAGTPGTWVAVF